MSNYKTGDPVYDRFGKRIRPGDTIIYAVSADGGQGIIRLYVVLEVRELDNHQWEGHYWGDLKVAPLTGSIRDDDGIFDMRPRYVQYPEQAIIVKSTEFLAYLTYECNPEVATNALPKSIQ